MRNYTGSAVMLAATMVLAIGCYSLSLRVSGERSAVEKLKGQLVADARDIRTLQAELRTRARLPELQRWNDQVATLQMKAPVAAQYLRDPVQLASFAAPPASEGVPVLRYAVTGQTPAPDAAAPAALERGLVRAAYVVPATLAMAQIVVARPPLTSASSSASDRRDLEALIGSTVDTAASRDAGHR